MLTLQLCQQKQKAGLEDCGGTLEWGDNVERMFETIIDKRDWKRENQESSSSDEEDEDPRNIQMEVDTTDRMFLLYKRRFLFYTIFKRNVVITIL